MADFRDRNENREFEERVIGIDRVARVVKGGRRFRFRAVVVIGDRKGRVGMGIAKAGDVTSSISKAVSQAKKRMLSVPITESGTIPYEITARSGGAKVFIKPASKGTGVIAGGAIRDVLEVVGVTDVLSKSLGSANKINSTYATLNALRQIARYAESHQPKAAPAKPAGIKDKA